MDNPLRHWAPESLTTETAFVVHIGPTAAGAFTALQGRVEHVRSGQSRRFASTEELVTFMCQCLDHPELTRRHEPIRGIAK